VILSHDLIWGIIWGICSLLLLPFPIIFLCKTWKKFNFWWKGLWIIIALLLLLYAAISIFQSIFTPFASVVFFRLTMLLCLTGSFFLVGLWTNQNKKRGPRQSTS